MLIIHGSYFAERLYLWGESSTPYEPQRRSKKIAPYVSFGADEKQLTEAFSILLPSERPIKLTTERMTLWLPTQDGMPIPSSALITDIPTESIPNAIMPWCIRTIPLDKAQTIALLNVCSGEQTLLAPGIIAGSDLMHWSRILAFTRNLINRQRVIPSIREIEAKWYDRWQPIFIGHDDTILHSLANTMPASARALNNDIEHVPAIPAIAIISSFAESIADFLMRPLPGVVKRYPPGEFGTVYDQWLIGLRSPVGPLKGTPAQLQDLSNHIEEWSRRLVARQNASFKIYFRLEEPANSEEDWNVIFLVQSRTDPSLLIPFADLWSQAYSAESLLQCSRNELLATLGEAALLSPLVASALNQQIPWGIVLTTMDAFTFLSSTAWLLEEAGFGVLLPSWWTRKGAKTRLSSRAKVRPPKLSGGGIGLNTMLSVDWQLILGDTELTEEEFQIITDLKVPLVRLRGQWIEADPDAIRTALAFWKKRNSKQLSLLEVLQLSNGGDTNTVLPVADVQAEGWVADLLDRLSDRQDIVTIPVPERLLATLRPYQARGFTWLHFLTRWGLGACLADDMGLGKTIQTLALILRDWQEDATRHVLLVCPTSVIENWRKETARFTPDVSVHIHHGPARLRDEAFRELVQTRAMTVTSYALLQRDSELLQSIAWWGVILDEAQNIKNSETKQAQAARSIPAMYRIALTGTPVENHVGDLWSLMSFLNPGYLGNASVFRQQFFQPIQINHDPDATVRLQKLTGPFILRRLKTDSSIIADLPEKIEMEEYCPLTAEQASLYAATLQEMEVSLGEAEGIQRKGIVLATLTKLKQICNHPVQFLKDGSALAKRSGKLTRLETILDELLAENERSLIFTQFAEMAEMLQTHLQSTLGREILLLTGQTSRPKRDSMIERFQREGDGPAIFVISLKAGGVGLNLTRANHVFHFDRWWNPAVENQATDRAFRIGQHKNVVVHPFICTGTVEEHIADLLASKREIAASIVGTGEGWLTELSTTEIRNLFALRQEFAQEV